MNCASRVKLVGNFAEPPLSDAVAVAKQLAEINRIRRITFKSYPGMEHVAVKVLLHIFLEQGARTVAEVAAIPDEICIRVATVQRYLHFLKAAGLLEIEKSATGQITRASLTSDANDVMNRYLNAIAGLLSQRLEGHR
jgi:predicted transcriptional regulator